MDLIPRKPIELHFCSSPAHLPVVRAAVEKMCDLLGMDSDATGGVVLSVDEASRRIPLSIQQVQETPWYTGPEGDQPAEKPKKRKRPLKGGLD